MTEALFPRVGHLGPAGAAVAPSAVPGKGQTGLLTDGLQRFPGAD